MSFGFVHLRGHRCVHRGDRIQDRKVGLGRERGVGMLIWFWFEKESVG